MEDKKLIGLEHRSNFLLGQDGPNSISPQANVGLYHKPSIFGSMKINILIMICHDPTRILQQHVTWLLENKCIKWNSRAF